jgi:sec-independent protein translocase protein TatB
MFDIGSSELLMIAIVAIVVIGPKDLPRALYKLGQIMGKARAMSRHFRSGIDTMIREVEMEELEKKWAADNQRIMAEHPDVQEEISDMFPAQPDPADQPAAPAPPSASAVSP